MDRVHFLKSDYPVNYLEISQKKGNFKKQIVQFVLDFLMSNFWVPDSSLLHDAGDIVSLQSLMILIYLRMISIYNNNIIFHGVIKIYTAARYYYYYTNIRAVVFFGKVC